MEKKKFDYKFLFLKILIFGIPITFALFQWFGPGIIQAHKQQKELEQIHYGGSTSEINEYINERNTKVSELNTLISKEIKKHSSILSYTNDTVSNITATLYPNIKFDEEYQNEYRIGNNLIEENQEIIEKINTFFRQQDKLGYNIFINDTVNREAFKLMNINKTDSIYKYSITFFYHYTDDTKAKLTDLINKGHSVNFSFEDKSTQEQLNELEGIQSSRIIITEDELQNKKIASGFKALNASGINKNANTFYFSCFNKKMDSILFLKKIEAFKSMYSKYKTIKNGNVVDVKIMK